MNTTKLQRLGFTLCDWHSGGGSGVYAVGSYLIAGHTPYPEALDRAIAELNAPYTTATEKRLAVRVAKLQAAIAAKKG